MFTFQSLLSCSQLRLSSGLGCYVSGRCPGFPNNEVKDQLLAPMDRFTVDWLACQMLSLVDTVVFTVFDCIGQFCFICDWFPEFKWVFFWGGGGLYVIQYPLLLTENNKLLDVTAVCTTKWGSQEPRLGLHLPVHMTSFHIHEHPSVFPAIETGAPVSHHTCLKQCFFPLFFVENHLSFLQKWHFYLWE